jgi:Flp pilus assembly protein TadG
VKTAFLFWRTVSRSEGAQLVEFAVTLPVLVVLFVAIHDFGQALNLKQKLTGATREGVRFAASQSTMDFSKTSTPPLSVLASRDVVDAYLLTEKVNDCGLATTSPTPTPNTWTWTFTTPSCGGGPLVLTVNRGFTYSSPANGGTTVEATQLTMTYPYSWQFRTVLQLLVPGSSYTTTIIGTEAVQQNIN